jgi:hypothetical protein
MNVPIKYLPKHITKKDKKTLVKELKKSRKAYKKNNYYTRKRYLHINPNLHNIY